MSVLRLLSIVSILLLAQATVAVGQKNVADVDPNDPAMNAAIAKARKTLNEFWSAYKTPKPGDSFFLKVKITSGDNVEHIWLNNIKRNGARISGNISNDPVKVMSIKRGQLYSFMMKDVTDWLYMRNGKMYGNETIRPLLKRMPKAEADHWRSMFARP